MFVYKHMQKWPCENTQQNAEIAELMNLGECLEPMSLSVWTLKAVKSGAVRTVQQGGACLQAQQPGLSGAHVVDGQNAL